MCSKMVALPLGIRHTRYRPEPICMMFKHMVYNVLLGVVDIFTPCAGVFESIMHAPYDCGEEFGIVDDLATSSARHVHCKCAAVMCSKMVALPMGLSHTRNRPKQICMMFKHMV